MLAARRLRDGKRVKKVREEEEEEEREGDGEREREGRAASAGGTNMVLSLPHQDQRTALRGRDRRDAAAVLTGPIHEARREHLRDLCQPRGL